MKYFTKYLPVEGEIKEGDMYHNGIGVGPAYKNENWKGQKVKLFLCSRDIQVGDKVRGEYPSTLGFDVECLRTDDSIVPHWAVKGQDGKEYYYAKQDSFKVIGEVSPDATWVKEGDEFEQLDIFADKRQSFEDWWRDNGTSKADKMSKRTLDKYNKSGKYIRIKGPCGHFH
jgi:hypothetical protein